MRIFACLCLVLLLTACKSNPFSEDLPKSLDSITITFEDTVRWGKLENLVRFLRQDSSNPPQPQEGLDNVRVTSYETSPLRQIDEQRWTITAIIDYVLIDRQIVRQVVHEQVWETADEGKTWFLASPLPLFQ
jgi:hypothetical protein